MTGVRPFTIQVSDEDLSDLFRRIDGARVLPDSPNAPPSGMSATYLSDLLGSRDTAGDDPRAVEHRISRDRLLTEAMIYWVTPSAMAERVRAFAGEVGAFSGQSARPRRASNGSIAASRPRKSR